VRPMRRVVAAAAIVAGSVGLAGSAARADAPRDQGWWTVTNPGAAALPVALPAAPPGPPDVPARGLLIQAGGGGAPTAYAALLYELDPGATPGKLTLPIAPNSVTTPSATLQICQLLQPINHPEQGGPIADAPPYNCAHKVTAAPSADGRSYAFDASSLVSDNLVAVAILPTGPADRVVFDAPGPDSLSTSPGTGSSGVDNSAATAGSDLSPAPSSDTASGLPATIASPSLADSLPGASAGPTSVSPPPAATPPRTTGSGGEFVPAVATGPEKATPLNVVLLVLGALAGAALWLYAGAPRGTAGLSRPAPG